MRILYLPNEYSQQRQREKVAHIYPVLMAMEAEGYRRNGDIVYWGRANERVDKVITEPEGLPFLTLPYPDRVFSRWWEYQNNGNYKYLPGTHMQVANGCWWGQCSFCVEKGKPYEVRPVDDAISEIEECQKLGFREIFDDSGTFPTGRWLDEFCRKCIELGTPTLGCNMRLFSDVDWDTLARANFRMLLFGIESANQETLDRIHKGVKVEDIIPTIKKAAEAGLEPHIAVMFGYPWETDMDALNTLHLVHSLLKKGYAKTAQASFYTQERIPGNPKHRRYIRKIYNVAYSPEFWFNQIKDIRNIDDLVYIWKGIKVALNG